MPSAPCGDCGAVVIWRTGSSSPSARTPAEQVQKGPRGTASGHGRTWPVASLDVAGAQSGGRWVLTAIASVSWRWCIVLRIRVTGTSGARTDVEVTGLLDVTGSAALLAKLDQLIDRGRHHLVINVSAVTFCDSSGISALVRSRAKAVEMAGSLRLASPSPAVQRVLDIAGLARVFER